jgi:molybdopterin-guanine dinucleotide biosynthesis protein A
MGRDKAALDYHGQPQVRWAYELVSRHCARTFVSLRSDQQDDPARAGLPTITDLHEGIGPIAGIAAAQAAHPEVAWLVVACDLPFLNDETLQRLVSCRGHSDVTAFRSAHDGLPEPLCAIYEPQTRPAILAAIAGGRHCPRKFLIASGYPLLDLPDARLLDNVNTPQEHETALSVLHGRAGGTTA